MRKHDWLSKYKYEDGIDFILHQFGERIPFQNNLRELFAAYKANQKQIDKLFKAFLKEIDKSFTKRLNLNKSTVTVTKTVINELFIILRIDRETKKTL